MKIITFFVLLTVTILLKAQSPFMWAKQLAGDTYWHGYSENSSIAVEKHGNVYTTGNFYGPIDFDPSPNTFTLSTPLGNGGTQIFISKLDSLGNFIWAKKFDGSIYQHCSSIAVDDSANVFLTGGFISMVDFDPGPGVHNLSSAGSGDIFISKLNSGGNLVWAKKMGSSSDDEHGSSITVDKQGNVYTVGYFRATVDFDPGPGIYNLSGGGASGNTFITKLNSAGNFVWAKGFLGLGTCQTNSMVLDSAGNIYTTGQYGGSIDFDPDSTVNTGYALHNSNVFICKLNKDANFLWVKDLGGITESTASSLSVDGMGNVYTTGTFKDTADFDPGPSLYNLVSAGDKDIFVSKLNSLGNFVFAKRIGGKHFEYSNSIVSSKNGNIYFTGYFVDTVDFDPGISVYNFYSNRFYPDIFICQLDSMGNFVCADQIGGTQTDYGTSITLDKQENVYLTGIFSDTADFDPGPGVYYLTSPNVFISKLKTCSGNANEMAPVLSPYPNTIFPNPSTGKFILLTSEETTNYRIKVYNNLGEQSPFAQDRNEIDLSKAPKGIYFIEIITNQQRTVKKVILN